MRVNTPLTVAWCVVISLVLLASVATAQTPNAPSSNKTATNTPATNTSSAATHSTADLQQAAGAPSAKFQLSDRLVDLNIKQTKDGFRVVLPTKKGSEIVLTPTQFIQTLHARQKQNKARGWFFVLLDITGWAGALWVGIGLFGQVLFTGRMVLQWIVSEKEKRSVVPNAFWWMSLGGASMLIFYFIWRHDIVGVLGQSTGWFIYIRNLWLIYYPKHQANEKLNVAGK